MWLVGLTIIWLSALSILDIRKRNVPVWLLAAGGIMAVVVTVYRQNVSCEYTRTGHGLIGMAMLPGILLLATAFATKKAGYGDGIVLMILGVLAGGEKCLLIFAISLFLGAFVSLILLVFRKVKRDTKIPFLPFLAVGWLAVMVF